MTRLLVLILLFFVSVSQAEEVSRQDFRICGYLPSYRFGRFDAKQAELLTDLILFAGRVSPEGGVNVSEVEPFPWKIIKDLSPEKKPRVHLCVVNAQRGSGFPEMTASKAARQTFIRNLIEICKRWSLSGVDLDWEFPKDEQEQNAYAQLLVELRKAFAPRGLTISVAMASRQKLPEKGFAAIDSIHVMAYDHAARHSTLEHARKDVQSFLDRGVPREKVVLGIPFYGRNLQNWRESIEYRKIFDQYKPSEDVDEVAGFYFNNRGTIRDKVDLAWDQQLGGVMIWEIGQDAEGEAAHLKLIRSTVERRLKVDG